MHKLHKQDDAWQIRLFCLRRVLSGTPNSKENIIFFKKYNISCILFPGLSPGFSVTFGNPTFSNFQKNNTNFGAAFCCSPKTKNLASTNPPVLDWPFAIQDIAASVSKAPTVSGSPPSSMMGAEKKMGAANEETRGHWNKTSLISLVIEVKTETPRGQRRFLRCLHFQLLVVDNLTNAVCEIFFGDVGHRKLPFGARWCFACLFQCIAKIAGILLPSPKLR